MGKQRLIEIIVRIVRAILAKKSTVISRKFLTVSPSYLQQLEHALALKDVTLADQLRRLELVECTSYNGVLVWKLSNFTKKKQDAMSGIQPSIYSPPFFTSRFGYKMAARLVQEFAFY